MWWLDQALWFTGLVIWAAIITCVAGLIGAVLTVVIQAAQFAYRIHKVIVGKDARSVDQFLTRWKYLIVNMPDAMRVRTSVNPVVWTTLTWDGTPPIDDE